MKKSVPLFATAVSSTILALAPAASAQEYYRQNPINQGGGYASQDARNPGGIGWFAEVADNFPGQSGWNINHVEFWGGYVADPATPGNTRGFTIRFYTDNDGHPGTRIYEQDVMTFRETQYYLSAPIPPTWPNGYAGYHYEVELPAAFSITTSGQYWVSVVAILDRGGVGVNEPQWGWVQASSFNAPAAEQWFFSPGNFAGVGVDESFVLSHVSARCVADVDNGSGTGTPDGGVTIEDLLYYLVLFNEGRVAADVDNGTGTGTPDGGVTIEDLLYFLYRFDQGC
jgi:hypothetical protein